MPETLRPQELIYGVVREPAMPFDDHQAVLLRLSVLLDSHVREHGLGRVYPPLDVVLDREAALTVQPDLLFVSNERAGIVDGRVWGAPDLVIEVASPSTAYRDRTLKLAWYTRYGVRECWLVDPKAQRVEVVDLRTDTRETFSEKTPIASRVLPEFAVAAERCFE
jgi:Uma2 family endonuclease